jgi:hypothetical protein
MKNYQLLFALQTEIQKHNLSSFTHEKYKVVMIAHSAGNILGP